MNADTRLQRVARGERPQYFEDPAIDKVLSIALALAGEVAVMRDRMDTLERLLESKQPVTRAAIESFQPSAEVRAERDIWRDGFLDVVMRSVHQELETFGKARDAGPYAKAIDSVENE